MHTEMKQWFGGCNPSKCVGLQYVYAIFCEAQNDMHTPTVLQKV